MICAYCLREGTIRLPVAVVKGVAQCTDKLACQSRRKGQTNAAK